jgi:uncharacterized protein YigE (DUF2233 family)
MPSVRVCAAVSILSCAVICELVAQNKTAPTPPAVDIISNALKGPLTRTLISGASKTGVYLSSVSVPGVDGDEGPLNLVWIMFPHDFATLRTCRVNKIGPANLLYETYSPPGALVLLNGGFYGFDDAHKGVPVGLLVSDGVQVSGPALSWKSGGIVFSREDSNVNIVPIASRLEIGSPKHALQSKPLLIEDGVLAVKHDKNDHPFNRSAIGLTATGDLIVVGAFREDGQALTIYDFGRFLVLLGPLKGLRIKIALNLDGATDAHFYISPSRMHFGYQGSNYVPDALAVVPR